MDETAWSLPSQFQKMLPFWLILGLGWGIGLILLASFGYEDSFLLLNKIRWSPADLIMPHLTHLGDGFLMTGIVGMVVSRKKPQLFPVLVITMITIWVLVTVGKQVLFAHWDRPLLVFKDITSFYYISLNRLTLHAFPSGHSAAVAGSLTVLAMYLAPRHLNWAIGLALGILIVSYTRLYIGVHFLGDIVIGSMLGCGVAVLVAWIWLRRKSPPSPQASSWTFWLSMGVALVAGGSLLQTYYL